MAGTANLNDIVSNETNPTAAAAPVSGGSGGVASLDDIAQNHGPALASDLQKPPSFLDRARTWSDKANDTMDDVATGFAKGAGDTVSGVSHLINKIPGVGETLAPSAGIAGLDAMDDTHGNTAQNVGKGLETASEFMLGDLAAAEALTGTAKAARFIELARKYPILARTLNMATAHPWLAKMILEGGKGAAVMGAQGAVKGAQQNDAAGGAERGVVKGALIGTAIGAAQSVLPGAASFLRKNPFRGVISGADAAQPAATSAVSDAAGAAAKDSGVVAAPAQGGVRTLLDDPIKQVALRERATYDLVNKAADTDLKNLYDYREGLHDALNDPTQVGNEQALRAKLADTESQIKTGESNALANKVDPKLLRSAISDTQQRYSLQALKKSVFDSEGVVKGNAVHGANEIINIDAAIKNVENLDKPSRWAPEGSPTRLDQALGPNGAKQFKQSLYDAQKEGQKYATRAKVARWLAGIAGVGVVGEGVNLLR